MQVEQSAIDAIREQIHAAFDGVPLPPVADMLSARFKNSDDAYEMAVAFAGKPWPTIAISVLSYHREMLFALSPEGYRAYLPAYLTASLVDDARVVGEVGGHMLDGLKEWSDSSAMHRATTRERLSLLDVPQRAAVASVLQYLETHWHMKRAGEILRDWRTEP